ncbi:MAG: nitroreductase family protein [Rhodospirillaceae bacterium]
MPQTAVIIDDDQLIRELVASVLDALGCTVVGEGGTGSDALPLYREHRPDVLFMDINRPGLNGADALHRLLSVEPGARVVMLTGIADQGVAESCRDAGALDVLVKSAGPGELRPGLARVLGALPKDGGAADAGAGPTSPVIDVLNRRTSVRSFTDDPVTDAQVRAVLAAGQRAPTSSNLQAYSFVVVRAPGTKVRLAKLAGNQDHVAKAPVFVAVCADIARVETVVARGGGSLAKGHLEMSMVAVIDAALAGMAASLAAESLGLAGCMIGGMRNDPEAVAEVLGLPKGVFVVFGMTLGVPADPPPAKPRLARDGVIHWERYEDKPVAELAERYSAELEVQKEASGRGDGVGWPERLAKGFSAAKRTGLKQALHNLGFDFD